jgi:hypothetical protein
MKKKTASPKLKLSRESIQLLDRGLGTVKGLSGGEDCSIGSGCISCHIPHCTTVP